MDFHPLKLAYFLLLRTKGGFIKGEPDEINDLFFYVGLWRIFHSFSEAFPQENPKTGFFANFAKSGFHFGFAGVHMPFGNGPMAAAAVLQQKKLGFSVVLTIYQAATGFFMSHFFVLLYGKAFTDYIISPLSPPFKC